MPATVEIWIDPAPEVPEVPEESRATLDLLQEALTTYGQERLADELRGAMDLEAMRSIEMAWLRTFVSRADPAYHRGRAWAKKAASNKGVTLSALKLKLGL